MMRRSFTREFKLDVCRKAESGESSKSRLGSFRALVLKAGGLSSFSSPASPGQNAFAESFFSRFKDEVVNLREPAGYAETEREIQAFVEDYNLTRKHSSLGDVSPTTFEERIAEHALELCVS